MKCRVVRSGFAAALCVLLLTLPAHATLKFFYDPATGNVSFDTSETRSETTLNYYLYLNHDGPHEFRYGNLVRLSESTFFEANRFRLSDEANAGGGLRGYFTIGDVLEPGLSEPVWTNLFPVNGGGVNGPGSHGYVDVIGGGLPPAASFVYGQPDRPYDNRWDLVDPDTLTWASSAKLIYRPWNGEVVVDTTGPGGGYISSIWLRSDSDIFRPENYTSIPGTTVPPILAGSLSIWADALEPGLYSLGSILDEDLTAEQFEGLFTDAVFMERAGFNGGSFDFETLGSDFALVWVPEPALASCVLGLGLLATRPRCRNTHRA